DQLGEDVLAEVQVVIELLPRLERVAHVRGDPLAGLEPVHHELGRAEADLMCLVRQAELPEDRDRRMEIDCSTRALHDFGLGVEHRHPDALAREAERGQQADRARTDDHDLAAFDRHAAAAASRRRSTTTGLVSTTNSAARPAPSASAPWM